MGVPRKDCETGKLSVLASAAGGAADALAKGGSILSDKGNKRTFMKTVLSQTSKQASKQDTCSSCKTAVDARRRPLSMMDESSVKRLQQDVQVTKERREPATRPSLGPTSEQPEISNQVRHDCETAVEGVRCDGRSDSAGPSCWQVYSLRARRGQRVAAQQQRQGRGRHQGREARRGRGGSAQPSRGGIGAGAGGELLDDDKTGDGAMASLADQLTEPGAGSDFDLESSLPTPAPHPLNCP
ncbi:uncharacterized protein J3D65DRAFT_602075 [Phyllosticta citribraziliensis]|uniref:Uncharacterized protein n=1 Tax=Phyllosticta citribraziliensis TaxID=989973 RepID=A0ABR1LY24_9PEZI